MDISGEHTLTVICYTHLKLYDITLYIYIIMQTMCMGLDQFEIEMNLGLHQPRLAKPDMELLL